MASDTGYPLVTQANRGRRASLKGHFEVTLFRSLRAGVASITLRKNFLRVRASTVGRLGLKLERRASERLAADVSTRNAPIFTGAILALTFERERFLVRFT